MRHGILPARTFGQGSRFIPTAVAVIGMLSAVPVAQAQAQTPATPPPAAVETTLVPAQAFDRLLARDAVTRLVKTTKGTARVYVDSSVASALVSVATPAGPLPQVLEQIAAVMPKGTVIRSTLLPTTTGPLDADTVASYIAAEAGIRKASGPAAADTVVVMGRALDAEKAKGVITALDLKPVYLITNGNADDPLAKLSRVQADTLGTWMSMTPEQRKDFADRQLDALINMDPATRRALFSQQMQMMEGFMKKIQAMPDDQRKSFFSDLTGGRWDGSTPPPPGGPK